MTTPKLTMIAISVTTLLVASESMAAQCTGTLAEQVACLNEKLEYVEMETDEGGRPIVVVTGANVQIRRASEGDKTGNLVVGSSHTWLDAEEGFVAGQENTIGASYATVSGGANNSAEFGYSSVSGGTYNRAIDYGSSVSGGFMNWTTGEYSTFSGGFYGTVSGEHDWRAGHLFSDH